MIGARRAGLILLISVGPVITLTAVPTITVSIQPRGEYQK